MNIFLPMVTLRWKKRRRLIFIISAIQMMDTLAHIWNSWFEGGRSLTTVLWVKHRGEKFVSDELLPQILVRPDSLRLMIVTNILIILPHASISTWFCVRIGAKWHARSLVLLSHDRILNLCLVAFATIPGRVCVSRLLVKLLIDGHNYASFACQGPIVGRSWVLLLILTAVSLESFWIRRLLCIHGFLIHFTALS